METKTQVMGAGRKTRILRNPQGGFDVFLADPEPPLWAWAAWLRDGNEARSLAALLTNLEAEPLYGADVAAMQRPLNE